MNFDDTKYRNWRAVGRHYAWRKAMYRDEKLRALAANATAKPYGVDLRQVAELIADEGVNGHHCFPSVETIAELIGCCEKTVQRHRKTLIELGWLKVTGYAGKNHMMILDIEIPEGTHE